MFSLAVKEIALDAEKIVAATEKAGVRVLGRQGGFVRLTMRNLIRSRKSASKPGEPPHAHASSRLGGLKGGIYYAVDAPRDSAVIGPVLYNAVYYDGDGKPVSGTIPETLEYGGTIGVREVFDPARGWRRADQRSRRRLAGKQLRTRRVTIAARPYSRPALDIASDKLPDFWANSVK